MTGAAIIAVSGAVVIVAIVVLALRMSGWAHDLGISEADRQRLERDMRDMADVVEAKDEKTAAMLREAADTERRLREELHRRRRPGDARGRLRRLLSKAKSKTAGAGGPPAT